MSLTSYIIRQGLDDKKQDTNKYGVSRRLIELITSFRTYRHPYESIKYGFLPRKKDLDLVRALKYAAWGGQRHFVEKFAYELKPTMNYVRITSTLIEYASRGGHLELVKEFVEELKEKHLTTYINNGLYAAIRENHSHIVEYLFPKRSPHGNSLLLYYAARWNRWNFVEDFIKLGLNDWNQGLYGAILSKNKDMVKFFIDKGASGWGHATLSAIRVNDRELVLYFLNKHQPGQTDLQKYLEEATLRNSVDIVNLFIERGVTQLELAMFAAIRRNYRHFVDIFIQHGAVNFGGYAGQAVVRKHADLLKYFVEQHGANNFNKYLLRSSRKLNVEVASYLIEKGANNFVSCIRNAALWGQLDSMQYFKEQSEAKGIIITKEIYNYCISQAPKLNRTKERIDNMISIIKFCIANGADDFNLCMTRAINYNVIEVITYLIEIGMTNFNSYTLEAIRFRRPALVKFFIEQHNANNFHECLQEAYTSNYQPLIDFFTEKLKEQ